MGNRGKKKTACILLQTYIIGIFKKLLLFALFQQINLFLGLSAFIENKPQCSLDFRQVRLGLGPELGQLGSLLIDRIEFFLIRA